MRCYNSTPLKRSFDPKTLPKDRKGYYASGSQYQDVCPIEAPFSDFNQKTPLHLVTKSDNSRFISGSIS